MTQHHARTRIAALGAALTVALLVAAFVVVGSAALARCGFSGPGQPGKLSDDLCGGDGLGRAMTLVAFAGPLFLGTAATVRAAVSRDPRLLRAPLLAAATLPVGVTVLYLISDSV